MEKNAKVFCKLSNLNQINFYLSTPEGTFYLFTNDAWTAVMDYFGRGQSLTNAMDMSKANNWHVRKVMEKLPKYVKYIESLEGITVLDKTRKKQSRTRNHYNRGFAGRLYE